jgi:hypothetical protein
MERLGAGDDKSQTWIQKEENKIGAVGLAQLDREIERYHHRKAQPRTRRQQKPRNETLGKRELGLIIQMEENWVRKPR